MSHNFFRIKTQFENIGDALINRELIGLVSKENDTYVCIENVPEKFLLNLNLDSNNIVQVNSFKDFLLKMVKLSLKRERVNFFLNPGGYGNELSLKRFISATLMNIFYMLLFFLGVKIHRFGVSFSNIGFKHKLVLRMQSLIFESNYVRDTLSLEEAKLKNIKVNGLMPDLAFLLGCEGGNKDYEYDAIISLRDVKNRSEMLSFIESIPAINEGKVLLGYQVEFDRELQELIYDKFKDSNVELLNMCNSISDNVEVFKKCKFVISNRLHILLLGMSSGCIPIALINKSENAKIVGIFQDNGFERFIADYNNKFQDFESLTFDQDIIDSFLKNAELLSKFSKNLDLP